MELAPRSIGEVVTSGIQMLARVWRRLLPPALGAFIPLGALTLVTFQMTGANEFLSLVINDPAALNAMSQDRFVAVATPFLNAVLIGVGLQVIATGFVTLAASFVVGATVEGEPITGGAASWRALQRLLPLVAILILTTAGVSVGLVLLVVPGIWLAISLAPVTHVVALENRGVFGSMTRSIRLVRGRWWATLGYVLLVGLMGWIAGQMMQLVAIPLLAVGDVSTGLAILFVSGLLVQGFIVAAIAVMTTVWYMELRRWKDGAALSAQPS